MYYDGQFDDARMAVTLAQSAADHGACLLNYARVTGLLRTGGAVGGAEFQDRESGARHAARAKVVVNACGIFADAVRLLDVHRLSPGHQGSRGQRVDHCHRVCDPW